jgi:hypothetical protein
VEIEVSIPYLQQAPPPPKTPMVPNLRHLNLAHTLTPCSMETRFNTINSRAYTGYIPCGVFHSLLAPTLLHAFFVSSTVSHLCNFTPEHSVARSTKPDHISFLCPRIPCRHYSNHHWDWIKPVTVFCLPPVWRLTKHNFIACRKVCVSRLML